MKQKSLIKLALFASIACMLAFTSCQKEELPNLNDNKESVVLANVYHVFKIDTVGNRERVTVGIIITDPNDDCIVVYEHYTTYVRNINNPSEPPIRYDYTCENGEESLYRFDEESGEYIEETPEMLEWFHEYKQLIYQEFLFSQQ